MATETEEAQGDQAPPIKKETMVLNDASLMVIAQTLGEQALTLAMYLNIPTTTLVHMQVNCRETRQTALQLAHQMLLRWRSMRAMVKEKDKVADLERALRDMGKTEMAAILLEKHQENIELDDECFASLEETENAEQTPET